MVEVLMGFGQIMVMLVEDYYKELVGVELKGKVSGVHAEVVKVLSRKDSNKNTTTLYINYKSSANNSDLSEGENNVSSRFRNNEDLLITKKLTIGETVLQESTPVAKVYTPVSGDATYTGSAAKLLDGIYFIRGFFIEYDSELIILDQYTNNPSYKSSGNRRKIEDVMSIPYYSGGSSHLSRTIYIGITGPTGNTGPTGPTGIRGPPGPASGLVKSGVILPNQTSWRIRNDDLNILNTNNNSRTNRRRYNSR